MPVIKRLRHGQRQRRNAAIRQGDRTEFAVRVQGINSGRDICRGVRDDDRTDFCIGRDGRRLSKDCRGRIDHDCGNKMRVGSESRIVGQNAGRGVEDGDVIIRVRNFAERRRIVERLRRGEVKNWRSAVRQCNRTDIDVGVQSVDGDGDIGRRVGQGDRIGRVGNLSESRRVAECLRRIQAQRRRSAVGQVDRGDLGIAIQRVDVRGHIRSPIGHVDRNIRIAYIRQDCCVIDKLRS